MAWIKQKPDAENANPLPSEASSRPSAPAPQPPMQPQRERRVTAQVNIGPSVQIKGDLTGQEDLTIEGKLEGKVLLDSHQLTIGANGRIHGEIHARAVVVVGELIGDITADDKVEIAASGSMRGNIRAPRVVLVDGADFRGSVDMDSRKGASQEGESPKARAEAPVREPSLAERDAKPAVLTGAAR